MVDFIGQVSNDKLSGVQNALVIPWNAGWLLGIPLFAYLNPQCIGYIVSSTNSSSQSFSRCCSIDDLDVLSHVRKPPFDPQQSHLLGPGSTSQPLLRYNPLKSFTINLCLVDGWWLQKSMVYGSYSYT